MYTQCPKCRSIFRISAEHLSARHGLVRCGQCQDVFNASWNLVDSVPAVPGESEQDQVPRPGGTEHAPAPTPPASVETPAGGHQVELFASENATSTTQPGGRARRGKRRAKPGLDAGTDRLLSNSMPFSVVADDAVERQEQAEPPVDAAATADDERTLEFPLGGSSADVAAAAGRVPTIDDQEVPHDSADSVADGTLLLGTGDLDPALSQDPDKDRDESPAAGEAVETADEEGLRATDARDTEAGHPHVSGETDEGLPENADTTPTPGFMPAPGNDEEDSAATAQIAPDEAPALEEKDRGRTAVERAGPSLAELFAAAEEPLPGDDDEPVHRDDTAAAPVIGDAFPGVEEPASGTDEMGQASSLAIVEPADPDDWSAAGGDAGTVTRGDEAPPPPSEVVEPVEPDRSATEGDAGTVAGGAKAPLPFDAPDAEEIVIEAPPTLWDAFDEEPSDGRDYVDTLGGGGSPEPARWGEDKSADERPADSGGVAAVTHPGAAVAGSTGEVDSMTLDDGRIGPPRPPRSSRTQDISRKTTTPAGGTRIRQTKDIKLVQIPNPRPLKTLTWAVAAIVLIIAGLWQVKAYYIGNLAQVTVLRPYLATLCDVFSCDVPPRRAFNLIDLVGTSVNTHPETPGALRVSVNLVNRADFEQAFPPLEITLSDKSGRVVGRRTYLPEEYLADTRALLVPKVVQEVDLDLAQPSENAVGYEIQLVAR